MTKILLSDQSTTVEKKRNKEKETVFGVNEIIKLQSSASVWTG